MRELQIGEKHYAVAKAITRLPRQGRFWREQAACREQEYGEGLDGTETTALRRVTDRYFIGRFCAQCVVQEECFIDGVQQGETNAVRGGQPALEMAKYSQAYQELMQKNSAPPQVLDC